MAYIQPLGQLRASVSTYAQLPITENVLGDLRIIQDLGVLYMWMSSSGSGDLTNWKKVTVSSYNDLTGRPNTSPLAIDDAMLSIRNTYLNYILLFFNYLILVSIYVLKMMDGFLDTFANQDTMDVEKLEQTRYTTVPMYAQRLDSSGYCYIPNFDGTVDEYTKVLIQGKHWNAFGIPYERDEFADALRNTITNQSVTYDDVITKFGQRSFYFMGRGANLLISNVIEEGFPDNIEGKDFTIDFWIKPETLGEQDIFIQAVSRYFTIIKNADEKLAVHYQGAIYNGPTPPYETDTLALDITGTTVLTLNTWVHVAVERQSGYLKLFVNGVLEATSTEADNHKIKANTNGFYAFGGNYDRADNFFQGWMEEFRYSHGIARYTSNFTPKTVAYNTPTESTPCDNIVLQSNGYEANEIPTSARIVIFEEDDILQYAPLTVEEVLSNEDIKAYVSRDGGTTFSACGLNRELDIPIDNREVFFSSTVNFYVGEADLSSQPSGKEMVWKITGHNNKRFSVRSVGLNWK
jgi:hypothetical protein